MAQELRSLISKVKDIDHENKELQSEIQALQNAFDEKMEDLGGQRQVKRVKESLIGLRKELKENTIMEGLMVQSLFNFKKHMDSGKNHLFDILDD